LVAAVGLSAFLLFQVQPIFARFILPWFGGGPGVWTTCMLFFQGLLLAGYAYAHALTTCASPKWQVGLHGALVALAVASLPLEPRPPDALLPSQQAEPTWQILGLLARHVALPYFVLSATGPLLQVWHGRVCGAAMPYRLYALSNGGSLLALLSYPVLVEPFLARQAQTRSWSVAFVMFGALILGVAWSVWRSERRDGNQPVAAASPGYRPQPPRWPLRMLWVALAACASVLLLATTNKLCQDVAVIPFLWIAPLSLYLLSFILCFDRSQWYPRRRFAIALPLALGLAVYALAYGGSLPIVPQVVLYACALFVCCMVCHGELHRLRPPAAHLTAFYLCLAAGGALGACFVALAAPRMFAGYSEFHWGLWALAALMTCLFAYERTTMPWGAKRARVYPWGLAGTLLLGSALLFESHRGTARTVASARNFYGVLRVLEGDRERPGQGTRVLRSGQVIHGLQFTSPGQAKWATGYYHEGAGVGLAMEALRARGALRVGVIGLGAGTLAAYGQLGDQFRFYEINPAVDTIARAHFSYLSSTPATVEVALGDARITLEREPARNYDLLVVDAFSGDAIPIHLLTREALRLYQRHLAPAGILAVHISNQHLDLFPVVRRLASDAGLEWRLFRHDDPARPWWKFESVWMLLARNPSLFDTDALRRAAVAVAPSGAASDLWTDEYASLAPILIWRPPERSSAIVRSLRP
jgi:hypothetical protein